MSLAVIKTTQTSRSVGGTGYEAMKNAKLEGMYTFKKLKTEECSHTWGAGQANNQM